MPPLSPRHVAALAVAITVVDSVVWFLSGYAGITVGVALVVALVVLAGRQTRDVGVSLVVAVLLAGFLVLLLATYWPRTWD